MDTIRDGDDWFPDYEEWMRPRCTCDMMQYGYYTYPCKCNATTTKYNPIITAKCGGGTNSPSYDVVDYAECTQKYGYRPCMTCNNEHGIPCKCDAGVCDTNACRACNQTRYNVDRSYIQRNYG